MQGLTIFCRYLILRWLKSRFHQFGPSPVKGYFKVRDVLSVIPRFSVRAFVVDFAVLSVIPRFSVSLFVMDLVSVSVIPSRSESCSLLYRDWLVAVTWPLAPRMCCSRCLKCASVLFL